jgi:peptidyl-tRNA hydrolase
MPTSDPAMYIFLNKGLGMSTGKSAAQASHAAVEAYKRSPKRLRKQWELGGHYKKLIMEARDHEHLCNIRRYLCDRGFCVASIIDEGHTEVDPHTLTALGVAIVDKRDPHTRASFSSFDLYKDPEPPVNFGYDWRTDVVPANADDADRSPFSIPAGPASYLLDDDAAIPALGRITKPTLRERVESMTTNLRKVYDSYTAGRRTRKT